MAEQSEDPVFGDVEITSRMGGTYIQMGMLFCS